jgi:hypothetical protein
LFLFVKYWLGSPWIMNTAAELQMPGLLLNRPIKRYVPAQQAAALRVKSVRYNAPLFCHTRPPCLVCGAGL